MTSEFIQEHARKTPVLTQCDVAVVGGGIAGIAAALSAARAGAKTLLLEQQYALGGLATLGLVTIYLPLCDGMGHQVSFGIAEELLRLAAAPEGRNPVAEWKNRSAGTARLEGTYNHNLMALETERLLLEEHVELLYGAQVCDAVVEDAALKALILETRSGRAAVLANSVVDCTGDARVCALAKEQTAIFRQQNILAAWYCASLGGNVTLHPLGACDDPEKYKSQASHENGQKRYVGLECSELTQFTLDAHRALMTDYLSKGSPSRDYQLTSIAAIPQIRMTRRLDAAMELDEPDEATRYEDSIGLIGNWKHRGPVYEIPFSCLHGKKIRNLIVAGRCISTTDTMWDNTRVIPACAVTGEAAGLAAALSGDFRSLSVQQLQQCLRERKIPLHPEELHATEDPFHSVTL